jgi:hypothetical protein
VCVCLYACVYVYNEVCVWVCMHGCMYVYNEVLAPSSRRPRPTGNSDIDISLADLLINSSKGFF